jgi:hypothetical protein
MDNLSTSKVLGERELRERYGVLADESVGYVRGRIVVEEVLERRLEEEFGKIWEVFKMRNLK